MPQKRSPAFDAVLGFTLSHMTTDESTPERFGKLMAGALTGYEASRVYNEWVEADRVRHPTEGRIALEEARARVEQEQAERQRHAEIQGQMAQIEQQLREHVQRGSSLNDCLEEVAGDKRLHEIVLMPEPKTLRDMFCEFYERATRSEILREARQTGNREAIEAIADLARGVDASIDARMQAFVDKAIWSITQADGAFTTALERLRVGDHIAAKHIAAGALEYAAENLDEQKREALSAVVDVAHAKTRFNKAAEIVRRSISGEDDAQNPQKAEDRLNRTLPNGFYDYFRETILVSVDENMPDTTELTRKARRVDRSLTAIAAELDQQATEFTEALREARQQMENRLVSNLPEDMAFGLQGAGWTLMGISTGAMGITVLQDEALGSAGRILIGMLIVGSSLAIWGQHERDRKVRVALRRVLGSLDTDTMSAAQLGADTRAA